MSEFRQDPTTKDWVIITPDRAKRPHDYDVRRESSAESSGWDPDCPFCRGNEGLTPKEIMRIPASSEWRVRVVPNRYAAVSPSGSVDSRKNDGMFVAMDGVGFHEVIIETTNHGRQMANMESTEVEDVLRAYRERYNEIRRDPRVRLVLIFRNQGKRAGTSLAHPHSQLIATPLVPPYVRRRLGVARDYFDDTGRCIYSDLREEEIALGERLVFQSDHFAVLEPFASMAPYETWIMPKAHASAFGDIDDVEIQDLALVLRDTLRSLSAQLDNPDFNYLVHTAPVGEELLGYYLWHIQIIPRLTTIAGFELGSGVNINTVLPEEAARLLRQGLQRSMGSSPAAIQGVPEDHFGTGKII